jgi:hypothetical protein
MSMAEVLPQAFGVAELVRVAEAADAIEATESTGGVARPTGEPLTETTSEPTNDTAKESIAR